MSDVSRFGVSVDDELLQSFDRLINGQGYENRSEAPRDLMRDALVKSRIESSPEESEALGSLTLVYDHHARELNDKMNELQHDHHDLVVSVLHVHISHDDCMEVIVLRGAVREIRSLSDGLLSLRGVKHGKAFRYFIERRNGRAKSGFKRTRAQSQTLTSKKWRVERTRLEDRINIFRLGESIAGSVTNIKFVTRVFSKITSQTFLTTSRQISERDL